MVLLVGRCTNYAVAIFGCRDWADAEAFTIGGAAAGAHL
jgi:hypothetical protein